MKTENQVKPPSKQKDVYNAFAEVYARIMNKEIQIEDAQVAVNALAGINRTYGLELKRAELAGETKPSSDFS